MAFLIPILILVSGVLFCGANLCNGFVLVCLIAWIFTSGGSVWCTNICMKSYKYNNHVPLSLRYLACQYHVHAR